MDSSHKYSEPPFLKPLPRVSSTKYARVKFRIKGQEDGPTYQGQEIIKKCRTCPGSPPVNNVNPVNQVPSSFLSPPAPRPSATSAPLR